jgi:hypothetical protein
MSKSLIIGLAVSIPIVIGGLGYLVYRTTTTKPNQERNSMSSTRSSESGVFRYTPDDRQSTNSVNPEDNQGYGWSNLDDYESNPDPTKPTYVGGKSKRLKNKKNKSKKIKR